MRLRQTGIRIETSRSKETILHLFDGSLQNLIIRFIETSEKFDRFYVEHEFTIFVDHAGVDGSKDDAIENARRKIEETEQGVRELHLLYWHRGLNQQTSNEGGFQSHLLIRFEVTKYTLLTSESKASPEEQYSIALEKLYSDQLSADEIASTVNLKARQHMEYLGRLVEPQETPGN